MCCLHCYSVSSCQGKLANTVNFCTLNCLIIINFICLTHSLLLSYSFSPLVLPSLPFGLSAAPCLSSKSQLCAKCKPGLYDLMTSDNASLAVLWAGTAECQLFGAELPFCCLQLLMVKMVRRVGMKSKVAVMAVRRRRRDRATRPSQTSRGVCSRPQWVSISKSVHALLARRLTVTHILSMSLSSTRLHSMLLSHSHMSMIHQTSTRRTDLQNL